MENNNINHIEHHKHVETNSIVTETSRKKIVIVGNPNVGKSIIFNFLSGIYVDVSNYPGTTIEVNKGKFLDYEVYDTPGIYGVSSFNDEERVARDIIIEADIIINVVDSVHLERDLFLTQQLIDMGKKLIVVLNFMDEAKKHNLKIDILTLQNLLGVPVVPSVAVKKEGFSELLNSIERACTGNQEKNLHTKLHHMLNLVGSQAEALLVLEGDDYISQKHGIKTSNLREQIYIERRNRVNYIINKTITVTSFGKNISTILGRLAINPVTGIPILIIILYFAYLIIGKLVAQDLVSFTESYFGNQLWETWIRSTVSEFIPLESFFGQILIGEFGILTMTVTYLIFLLLPLVFAFYITLSFLEDTGYLPRLATMVDRIMNFLGLNGRAIIPLILGFGCVSAATITTRLLSNEREKTIATAILQFAIPCSAQLAVIAALLMGAGFKALLIYTIVILSVLVILGTLLNKFLKGEAEPLLIDLPPLRFPKINNVLQKTMIKTLAFMKEATPWFFFGAAIIGIMQFTGLLIIWQKILSPLVENWLKLPGEAAIAFVMGLVRRDFGAAGLYEIVMTPMQTVVALTTITLFVPCITSLLIMYKERGFKAASIIWIGTWIGSFTVGGIVANIIM